MGVINVTPDSFSDGGRALSHGRTDVPYVVDLAAGMLAEGAALLDVGGESTRPGAASVSADEELRRVMPVIDRLIEFDTVVSIDTSKPEVAERAIAAGCGLVNDVCGLGTRGMLEVVANSNAAACIMHMQGSPRSMQVEPHYDDVVSEVAEFFVERIARCRAVGIESDRLVLDPGFGFGKTLEHNLEMLRGLGQLRIDGLPLLVGLSRKSMLGKLTGRDVDERLVASAVAAALAVERGADIIRVHDVSASHDALALVNALTSARRPDQG